MAGPWDAYKRDDEAGPWSAYRTQTQNFEPARPETGLDYSKPIEELRPDIAKLPEDAKKRAYDIWASKYVADERSKGLAPLPEPARGIPIIGNVLDEASALINSGLHSVTGGRTGRPYDESLAYERARLKQAEQASPALAAISQLATGIVTGGPVLSRIPPAATTLGRMGQGAAIGGGLGYAEGFLGGEGSASERHERGMQTAGAGMAVGALAPPIVDATIFGAGKVRDAISPAITRWTRGPEEAADVILAQRIAREGSTPGQKRLDLQQGQNAARLDSNSRATLPETIADTSNAMRRLGGNVYRAGGEAGNLTKQMLDQRQRGPDNPFAKVANGAPDGQFARVTDTAERALLVKAANSARQTDKQLMLTQKTEGKKLYDAAFNGQDQFDIEPAVTALGLVIQQYPGPFAARLNRARNLFVQSGVQGNRPFYVNELRRFDNSKKALDDMIEKANRAGEGNLVRELTDFKHALLSRVHDGGKNKVYQQAREAWGSAAENRAAIDLGKQALKDGSEVSAEAYRELTSGQQRLFRIGFLDSLRGALASKKPGDDITQLFQQRRVQELMREVIPESKRGAFSNRAERFGEIMRREQRMVQTRNEVLGGPQTAQRLQDDQEFAGSALRQMYDRFRSAPSLFNVGVEAVGAGIEKVFGYRQDVALALARRLFETDRKVQNQILNRLARRGGPSAMSRFADALDRTSTVLVGSGAAQIEIEPQRIEGR